MGVLLIPRGDPRGELMVSSDTCNDKKKLSSVVTCQFNGILLLLGYWVHTCIIKQIIYVVGINLITGIKTVTFCIVCVFYVVYPSRMNVFQPLPYGRGLLTASYHVRSYPSTILLLDISLARGVLLN